MEEIDLSGAILRVMPENVTHLWPQLEQLFVDPIAQTDTHTLDDLRRMLMAMQSQLWVQLIEKRVVAAVVTEFVNYPKGLTLRVWLAGAIPERPMDKRAFVEVLDRWRLSNGCRDFELIGRHGWVRVFPWARVAGLMMRGTP